jgi:uncharacterized membrane protein YkvA (DUF1232 family)/ubiquinone/menaquinone biosynthesis C-methylase UbiE
MNDHVEDRFPREEAVALIRRLPAYALLAVQLGRDPGLPASRRGVLVAAAAYLVSPIDAVPGIIPLIGQLDDLLVVILALRFALAGMSPMERHRHLEAVGLSEALLAADERALLDVGAWALRAAARTGRRLGETGMRTAVQSADRLADLGRSTIGRLRASGGSVRAGARVARERVTPDAAGGARERMVRLSRRVRVRARGEPEPVDPDAAAVPQRSRSRHDHSGTSRFDEKAAEWDTPERRARAREAAAAIRAVVPLDGSMRVIDLGAGTGLLGLELARDVASVVLAEPSTGMLAVAREKLGSGGPGNVTAIAYDLPAEPPPGSPFDLAVSLLVLHHVEDTTAALRSIRDLLAPGGRIALLDLDAEDGSFHSGDAEGIHHHGFERAHLKATAEAVGFRDVGVSVALRIEQEGRSYGVLLLSGTRA